MEDKSRALPAFHAVNDCDTISFFGWKGKLKTSNTWTTFPTVASAFFFFFFLKNVVLRQQICHKRHLRRLSNLLCSCMKKKCSDDSECSKQRPSSQQCKAINTLLHRAPRMPSPSAWGWTKGEGQPWQPLWTILRQAEDSYCELIHYGCK